MLFYVHGKNRSNQWLKKGTLPEFHTVLRRAFTRFCRLGFTFRVGTERRRKKGGKKGTLPNTGKKGTLPNTISQYHNNVIFLYWVTSPFFPTGLTLMLCVHSRFSLFNVFIVVTSNAIAEMKATRETIPNSQALCSS